MKPGFKTTEFWVTIAIQLTGVLAAVGVFTPDQADSAASIAGHVAGIIAMLGSGFGYSISRGMSKKSQ